MRLPMYLADVENQTGCGDLDGSGARLDLPVAGAGDVGEDHLDR